jgi:hypothetical protein
MSGVTEAGFGVDMFRLRSRSATATVTRVELVGVRGQIRLTRVLVVPYGGVGSGFPWGSPVYAQAPAWNLRQALPAHLHYVPPAEAPGAPQTGDRTRWQVVVDVAVTGRGGYADHVRLTLTDGGHTYHVDGRDRVALLPTYAACAALKPR